MAGFFHFVDFNPVKVVVVKYYLKNEWACDMTDDITPQNDDEKALPDDPGVLRQVIEALNRRVSSLETEKQKANKQAEERRLALDKAQQEAEAERERILAEQGNFKKLYEERESKLRQLEGIEQKYQAHIERVSERNQERIAKIPEQFHALIPIDTSPESLSEWLDVADKTILSPKAPDIDAGARSTGGGKVITAEMPAPINSLADIAEMNGFKIDRESLAKRVKTSKE